MIDFLKDCGIDNQTILELNNIYSESVLFSLNCNELEIKKIFDYFKNIGLNCVDRIVLEDIDLLFMSFDDVKAIFEKYDVPRLVEMINNNFNVIYQI